VADQVRLSDEQQQVLTAVSDLEAAAGRPPSLEEIAERLGWEPAQARAVLSTLLSGQADLVRELSAVEPADSAYAVKARPAP
jgi:DNA-directed RNA polymerase specialized sigma subunit